MRADVVELRAAAPKFSAAADRVEDAGTRLRAVLAAEGSAWGADTAGVTFAGSYLPGAGAAGEGLSGLADVLAGVRTALDRAAAAFQATEDANRRSLGGGN